jgi:hypothetical protein
MEVQYLEEKQDDTMAIEDDTNASITHFDTETSGRITQSDWEDAVPMDLATSSKTEEGPEVFKRVRFLSRWEFRHESRGKLRYQIDQYSWWGAGCPEAVALRTVAASAILRRYRSERVSLKCDNWETCIGISLCFVGKTLQQSIPVLLVFSMDKKRRRRVWETLSDLEWVRANPSLILLTTCHSIFQPAIKIACQSTRGDVITALPRSSIEGKRWRQQRS